MNTFQGGNKSTAALDSGVENSLNPKFSGSEASLLCCRHAGQVGLGGGHVGVQVGLRWRVWPRRGGKLPLPGTAVPCGSPSAARMC